MISHIFLLGIIKALPSLHSSSLTQLMRSQGKYTRLLEILTEGMPWHHLKNRICEEL